MLPNDQERLFVLNRWEILQVKMPFQAVDLGLLEVKSTSINNDETEILIFGGWKL